MHLDLGDVDRRGADAHAFAAAGDEPGEPDAQHIVARRERLDHEAAVRCRCVAIAEVTPPSAETSAPDEGAAALVADDALDAPEGQARLLEGRA